MIPDRESVDQAAAQWLAHHEQGLSPARKREFACWLEADERHARTFRDLQQSWSQLDRVRGSKGAPRLEAELEELSTLSAEAFDPYPVQRFARFRPQPWISGALAAGLAWGVAYFAWWRPLQTNAPHAETAATEIGIVRSMELPDGSIVRLNTNTAIEVLFTQTERRVRLGRGEAFFTIATNPARPFIVRAVGVDVRAVGTEFNVRLRAESVEVTVREGKVRVEDAENGETLLPPSGRSAGSAEASSPILRAGQRVVIPVTVAPKPTAISVAPVELEAVEIERSLAWQNRRLVFDSTPLQEIAAELNRYNRRPLVIADPELASRHFGGTFEANDPRTFLELLRTSYDVVTEERAGETVLRLRK